MSKLKQQFCPWWALHSTSTWTMVWPSARAGLPLRMAGPSKERVLTSHKSSCYSIQPVFCSSQKHRSKTKIIELFTIPRHALSNSFERRRVEIPFEELDEVDGDGLRWGQPVKRGCCNTTTRTSSNIERWFVVRSSNQTECLIRTQQNIQLMTKMIWLKKPLSNFSIFLPRRTYGTDRDSHSNYSTECKVMHGRCDDD